MFVCEIIVCVHFGALYSWMNWIAPTPGVCACVCVCVAIVFLPVTIRGGLRRSLFKRPWCEAETKSRQKDSLTLWQRSLKTTKRWRSLASVIRCRSADARFRPGKHRKIPNPSARVGLPKHNPISVTSQKCILLTGTMHSKMSSLLLLL